MRVKTLIADGARVNALNKLQETPIDVLMWNFSEEVDERENMALKGDTIIIGSIEEGDMAFEILLYLKEQGGTVNRFSKEHFQDILRIAKMMKEKEEKTRNNQSN